MFPKCPNNGRKPTFRVEAGRKVEAIFALSGRRVEGVSAISFDCSSPHAGWWRTKHLPVPHFTKGQPLPPNDCARTLHLTNSYHPSSGGVRIFYQALFAAANELGRPMRAVVPGPETRVEPVGESGRIYYVKSAPAPIGDSRYRMLLPFGAALKQILRDEQPDLVEVGDKYTLPWLAGWMKWRGSRAGDGRRPVLVAMNNERLDDNLRAYTKGGAFAQFLGRQYLRRALMPMFDCHIANSEYTAAELRRAVENRAKAPRIAVLPMGVDTAGLGPDRRSERERRRLREAHGLPADAVLLLYVGRLANEKNLPLLAQTLAELPERFVLLVAGSGAAQEKLRKAGERLAPGRVKFVGQVNDRDALAQLYANADVFVHSNPREPFGIAPMEAMASGLPLVAPDRGGVVTYANESNAWLAEPTGPAFAAAVLRAVTASEPQRQAKLAEARRTAEAYAWPLVARKFFALYDELAAGRA